MSYESFVVPKKGTRTVRNVTVAGSTPTLLAAANGNRKTLLIQNQGAVTVFLGDANVATSGSSTGIAMFAGTSFTDNASTSAWYGIPASSAAVINVVEVA